MPLYRDFATPEILDAQYLADADIAQAAVAKCMAASQTARSRIAGVYGVRYGPTAEEYLDVFPSGRPGAPVHLFIHGGYWHQLSPELFSFVAERLVERGITVVINNYAHCPDVTIDEIVRQCQAAVAWIVDNIVDFDGDPENLSISGHSAGGHLAVMMAHTDWDRRHGGSPTFLRGVCGISGLYDLRPFPFTALQSSLRFTPEQILRNSPILLSERNAVPTTLLVGALETDEFHRQATDYARKATGDGAQVTVDIVPAADHFNILDGFTDPDSRISRAIVAACAVS